MENGVCTKTEKYLLSEMVRDFCYKHSCRSCPLITDDGIRICCSPSWDGRLDFIEKVIDVLRKANYEIPKSLDLREKISITEDELMNLF